MNIFRKALFIIVMVSTLLLPQKNGFGVSFSGLSSVRNYYYYETVELAPAFYWLYGAGATRMEAAFGYWSRGRKDYSSTITSIGLGGMLLKSITENFSTYYGGRIVLHLSKDDDETEKAFDIAPVYGGEYKIGNNASIGGEIQLNYFRAEGSDWHTTTLKSLIFLRFYY